VVSGMTASTCLTVLFVPSFFVLLQRLEERLRGPKRSRDQAANPEGRT
jgi:HAE1 family hydrophobic/amphiphilic exporter-1